MDPVSIIGMMMFFGTILAVVRMLVHAFTGGGKKALAAELSAAQDRARSLEVQLIDSHRQVDQLQKQLDWHVKMLDTQDRLVKQLTAATPAPSPAAPAAPAPAPTPTLSAGMPRA